MKILLRCVFLCLLCTHGTAKAKTQTDPRVGCDTSAVMAISGKIHIANTGFAPIPAFSFNKPIPIVSLTIRKKRFSYEPDFAVGLNRLPWMINNSLNVNIIDRRKYSVETGVNPSLFFESKPSDFG